MDRKEKELHVSRYDKKISNKKEEIRFYAHVQHFLEDERSDDQEMAEVLDLMYQKLIEVGGGSV